MQIFTTNSNIIRVILKFYDLSHKPEYEIIDVD